MLRFRALTPFVCGPSFLLLSCRVKREGFGGGISKRHYQHDDSRGNLVRRSPQHVYKPTPAPSDLPSLYSPTDSPSAAMGRPQRPRVQLPSSPLAQVHFTRPLSQPPQEMGLVRDPAFWKRFSTAVHQAGADPESGSPRSVDAKYVLLP